MPEQDAEYVRVNIEEFATGASVPYAVFIRLSSWKYLKIANPGDALDQQRLDAYKDKNVTALYLLKEDFAHYLGGAPAAAPKAEVPSKAMRAMSSVITEQPTSSDPAAAAKLKSLCANAQTTLELLRTNQISDFLFETAKDFVTSTISVYGNDRSGLALLQALNTQKSTNFIYEHSLGVSLYSVMLARVLGWQSSINIFKVGLGGLLHDIGLNSVEESLVVRPENTLTIEERKKLQQHCEWGAQIVRQLSNVPPEVVAIILQHHETLSGTGYPAKLTSPKIHPMAKLVAVANRFCELVLDGPASPRMSLDEAYALMCSSNNYDADVLSALRRLIKGLSA